MPIRDVALRICRKQRTIGRGGEKGSGISLLIERHDDDDLSIKIDPRFVCDPSVIIRFRRIYFNFFNYSLPLLLVKNVFLSNLYFQSDY